jgi:phosphoglycolate phosphatase
MKKKLIIFDMDGVLFDSTKLVNAYFMHKYPTMTREKMNEILSGNFHEGLEKFKLDNKPVEETPEESKGRSEQYTEQKLVTPLYKGIMELLQSLHLSGYTLTINTSAYEKNCLPLLQNSQVKGLFDFVATAEVSTSKVEKFKIIRDRYAIPTEDTLFITDTLGDVYEAETAQIPSVAVTWGAHDRSYFTRESHKNIVAIVDSVGELEAFIKSN